MKKFREFLAEERVDFRTYNLRRLYDELNRKYWDSALPADIEIGFKALRKGLSGLCQAENMRNPMRRKVYNPGSGKIWISKKFFEMDKLKAILMHEMIHLYLFVNDDFDTAHGKAFLDLKREKEKLLGIDIPVTDDDVEAEEYGAEFKQCAFLILKRSDGHYSVLPMQENLARQKAADIQVKYSLYMKINVIRQTEEVSLVIGTSYLSKRFPVVRVFNVNKGLGTYKITDEDFKSIKVKEKLFTITRQQADKIDLSGTPDEIAKAIAA